jgi:hypothetical protein
MLVTIAITLLIFCGYHLYLIYLNLTTNEKSKRSKLLNFMSLIKETLKGLNKEKGHEIDFSKSVKLSDDDIQKYKQIAFKSSNLII